MFGVSGSQKPTKLESLRGQSPFKLPNFFLDFGIPKLRTFFEDFDPMWPLQRSYCLENVRILSLSILGFHQNLSKILIFISQSPPFYENPISSVRPSETQNSRFLCVHPHSGGVVGFSIIGFSSMTPPPPVAAAAAAANPRRSFLQNPGPAHHSHPGTKYPVRGPLTPTKKQTSS